LDDGREEGIPDFWMIPDTGYTPYFWMIEREVPDFC